MRHTSKKQQMCVCVQLCYPCRSFSPRWSAVPLAGETALHGLQLVSRPCTVRSLCCCVPQGRVTHMGSATPGTACALDVVGTPLRLWGPAVHEHCPFAGRRWIWLSVSRPCTVRSLPLRPPGKNNSYGFSHYQLILPCSTSRWYA